jgi:hypothetical protein
VPRKIEDAVLLLLLTALISGGIGSLFPALYNALFNRGFEQEKRLAGVENESQKVAAREGCKRWSTRI